MDGGYTLPAAVSLTWIILIEAICRAGARPGAAPIEPLFMYWRQPGVGRYWEKAFAG